MIEIFDILVQPFEMKKKDASSYEKNTVSLVNYLKFNAFKNGCYANSLIQAFLSLKGLLAILNTNFQSLNNNQFNFNKIIQKFFQLKLAGNKTGLTYELRKLVDSSSNFLFLICN